MTVTSFLSTNDCLCEIFFSLCCQYSWVFVEREWKLETTCMGVLGTSSVTVTSDTEEHRDSNADVDITNANGSQSPLSPNQLMSAAGNDDGEEVVACIARAAQS